MPEKRIFMLNNLLSASSDLRKTWSVIKQIISKRKPAQPFFRWGDNTWLHSIYKQFFIDFKKALFFDSVNHEIPSDKLNFYGVCGVLLTWPTSYLNDRQQYEMIHDHILLLQPIRLCERFPRVPFLVLSFFSFICSQIFFSLLSILQSFSLLVIETFL